MFSRVQKKEKHEMKNYKSTRCANTLYKCQSYRTTPETVSEWEKKLNSDQLTVDEIIDRQAKSMKQRKRKTQGGKCKT